jgi:outer membrane biosynthesis protein TonB
VIGIPLRFQTSQLLVILPSGYSDPQQLAELYIHLEFTVGADGTVSKIEVTDTNAPSKLVRTMKQALNKSQFRPRVVEGQPVDTDHFQLTQLFK